MENGVTFLFKTDGAKLKALSFWSNIILLFRKPYKKLNYLMKPTQNSFNRRSFLKATVLASGGVLFKMNLYFHPFSEQ
jgi:hypothetical protein